MAIATKNEYWNSRLTGEDPTSPTSTNDNDAWSENGVSATATITITDFTELNTGDKVNLVATDGTNYDFTNGDQSSVNGTWESTTSNDATATNLMNVINTSSGPSGTRFTATVDGAEVTVTQATTGTDGNTTVTLTDSGTAGMTKTNFTGGGRGGSASGGAWVVTNDTYSIASSTAMTMVAMLSFNTAPTNAAVLMTLDNGVKRVQVKSKGNLTQLDLVGATTVTISDLDLGMAEDGAVPLTLRLTLDASGNAKLYKHEILNDTDGNAAFYSIVGASTSSATASFGNTSGSVNWEAVYFSKFGAFSPEELMLSAFAQDTLPRMGLTIVDALKNCTRPFIKKYVNDSSIVYGYDLSSQMLNRMVTPTIHVVFTSLSSPNFSALGGSSIDQFFDVAIYTTTKGTNYENSYRLGLNIMGEIFDELYTTTGLQASTDNLESYNMTLDSKMDDDETICVHQLNLSYRRRIKMTRR